MSAPSEPVLLRSPWPAPVPDGYGRALDFHLTAFARWLLRAGAEPRLALVLCSGPAARDRFVEGVAIDGVEVQAAPASTARPVHPAISGHQGSHFNRTLYVVDGLTSDRGLLEALDGRTGMLARSATWVALVVERLDVLGALYAHAPRLAGQVMRRCLVLDGHAAGSKAEPLDPGLRARWTDARLAERIYHHAMTPGAPPALLDFDRLARTGYLPAQVGRVMHPERQRLAALWNAGPEARALPFTADQAGPVAAEAALRRAGPALDPTLAKRLIARLDDVGRLGAGEVPGEPRLADLRAVRAMGTGDAPLDPAVVERCRRAVGADGYGPALTAHAHQALAMAAAAAGDLEACAADLEAAGRAAGRAGLPELLFDVLEKQIQIAVFAEQRGPAKSLLERLEALAPLLHGPFFAARARLARGEYTAPLDPARAAVELGEAERLFRAHGYPTWAATAREALP